MGVSRAAVLSAIIASSFDWSSKGLMEGFNFQTETQVDDITTDKGDMRKHGQNDIFLSRRDLLESLNVQTGV